MSTELIAAPNPVSLPFRSAALDLNIRQKSFVDYYIQVKVGWKAAELAGYSGNRDTLMSVAYENLRKPQIAAYYEERLQELAISSTEVLAEIGAIARFDVIGEPKGPIRALDKLKALELAGKYHKLFEQPVDQQVNAGAVASEVVALLVALAERNRAAQAEQAQLAQLPPVVVIETAGREISPDRAVAVTPNSEDGP